MLAQQQQHLVSHQQQNAHPFSRQEASLAACLLLQGVAGAAIFLDEDSQDVLNLLRGGSRVSPEAASMRQASAQPGRHVRGPLAGIAARDTSGVVSSSVTCGLSTWRALPLPCEQERDYALTYCVLAVYVHA